MAITAILQDVPMKQSGTVFFLRDIKASSQPVRRLNAYRAIYTQGRQWLDANLSGVGYAHERIESSTLVPLSPEDQYDDCMIAVLRSETECYGGHRGIHLENIISISAWAYSRDEYWNEYQKGIEVEYEGPFSGSTIYRLGECGPGSKIQKNKMHRIDGLGGEHITKVDRWATEFKKGYIVFTNWGNEMKFTENGEPEPEPGHEMREAHFELGSRGMGRLGFITKKIGVSESAARISQNLSTHVIRKRKYLQGAKGSPNEKSPQSDFPNNDCFWLTVSNNFDQQKS
ncbi:hypothetical protein PAAG_03720 [Paracoccidioides lutzii Pb01]|uniref:Uncharacterized protein n=1 Tax=Paracoccidioides lutzii (strain ATCC MYA-826 / Pb01) TaxID=502779 RepID=C1GYX6_PARBA|nr:hypothetical protein PAAG_03720 [Paracoccidioides lutzii Pb01]EEH41799.2 hypothetical protein PAAG_03720 [Paracoccidioides lutzii Pb01]